jgi:cysteine-rich repeat protein
MRWIALAITLASCISDQLVPCGDRTCPAGDRCVANECASDAQIGACDGLQPGDVCSTDRIPHGFCVGTVGEQSCQPSTCGNGVLEQGEVCDDGNVKSGDGCSGDCQSDETCGNGYVDGIVGEQCDTGVPFLSGDGCTSLCTVEGDSWRDDTPVGFRGRIDPAVAYDSHRKRLVMFGGTDLSTVRDDTWEWDGASWQHEQPAFSPSPRYGAAIAYDATHERVIVFGGYDLTQVFGDTWSYDGITWTQLAPATSPTVRVGARMTYDPARHLIVLFGGVTVAGANAETWLWDGATWTRAVPTMSPPPRLYEAMAFDAVSQQIVMAGGATTADVTAGLGDTWLWDGATWTQSGIISPRLAAAAATNPQTGHVVLCGGRDDTGTVLADCYSWSGASWLYAGNLPEGRAFANLATDTDRGQMVMVAGFDPSGPSSRTYETPNAAAWTLRAPALTPPANVAFGLSYDVMRDRLVMYGNQTGNDVWEWDGVWHHVVPIGPSPTPRVFAALAYDEARRTTVLFGGETFANAPLGDTWAWDGVAWHQRTPLHSPPTPTVAKLVFDRARGVALMLDDTFLVWMWDGVDWTSHPTVMSPLPTTEYQLAYDATAQRTIVYGGERMQGATVTYADTWSWDGIAWSHRMPPDDAGARARGAAAFDNRSGRVVLIGGQFSLGSPTSTWTYGYAAAATVPDRCIAGIDTDGDGRAGCDDPDCWARCQPMCAPEEPCDATLPHCGDGSCSSIEDYVICPADCPAP